MPKTDLKSAPFRSLSFGRPPIFAAEDDTPNASIKIFSKNIRAESTLCTHSFCHPTQNFKNLFARISHITTPPSNFFLANLPFFHKIAVKNFRVRKTFFKKFKNIFSRKRQFSAILKRFFKGISSRGTPFHGEKG